MNMMGIFIASLLEIAVNSIESILHHFLVSSLTLSAANLLAYAVGFIWRTFKCYGSYLPIIKGKGNYQPRVETGRAAEIRGVIEPRCSIIRWFPVNAEGPE